MTLIRNCICLRLSEGVEINSLVFHSFRIPFGTNMGPRTGCLVNFSTIKNVACFNSTKFLIPPISPTIVGGIDTCFMFHDTSCYGTKRNDYRLHSRLS